MKRYWKSAKIQNIATNELVGVQVLVEEKLISQSAYESEHVIIENVKQVKLPNGVVVDITNLDLHFNDPETNTLYEVLF